MISTDGGNKAPSGDKYVDISGDITQAPLEPYSLALIGYWRQIRNGDLAPNRNSLRPGEIPRLLPGLMLLEYRAPDTLICRLTGTGIVERMGRDFTGVNLFDIARPAQLAATRRRFDHLRTHPCGLVSRMQLTSKYNTPLAAEQIYLPLRDRGGEITQLVSVVSVIKRFQPAKLTADFQPMATYESVYLDIGAGVPVTSHGARRAAG